MSCIIAASALSKPWLCRNSKIEGMVVGVWCKVWRFLAAKMARIRRVDVVEREG